MGPMEVVVEGAGAKKIKQDFWGIVVEASAVLAKKVRTLRRQNHVARLAAFGLADGDCAGIRIEVGYL